MDRFHALQIFVAVAETCGFASAARQLNLSPPAVTRAVAQLEDRLGTRLFVRTTRSVRLSESGERFLSDARRLLIDLEEAEEAAIGSHTAPRGDLNITAPVLFGRMNVAPILADFLDDYPLVNARTLFVDRVVNLMDEGMDVAIRIGDLPSSSLTAVRCGSVRRMVFASPDYIRQHGRPKHPNDLQGHRVIQPLSLGASDDWAFIDRGKGVSVRTQPRLRMNTNDAVIDLVRGGWGVSCLLSYQIAPDLNVGRLETILEDYELPPLPIHVVHQEGRLVSAKVRAFVDYMVARLRANVGLNG